MSTQPAGLGYDLSAFQAEETGGGIGEAERFPWDGGIIRFIMQNNKVHFEVNLDAANAAGLKISSKLLRLARIFNGGGNHPSSDGPESTEPAARPADGPPSQE